MTTIKDYIKQESSILKFKGIAPDGFILLHEKTLENLKDFDVWKDWKNNIISINELDKKILTKIKNLIITKKTETNIVALNDSEQSDSWEQFGDNISF